MALAVHNITGDAWTPITAAGLSGTCWLQEIPGKGQVVINHSETLIEFEIDESYFLLNAKRRLQLIGAESGEDIYYARCSVPGNDAVVITDTGHGFVGDPIGKMTFDPDDSLRVRLQDSTTPQVIVYANQVTNTTELTVATAKDNRTITVDDPTGIIIAPTIDQSYIGIFDTAGDQFYAGFAIGLAGNVVTLDSLINSTFPIGSTVGIGIKNMAVDGSTDPQTFTLRGADPGLTFSIDITRLMIYCITETFVNLTDFGDIEGGLLRGLQIRSVDGITTNIINYHSNIEMKGIMFDWDSLDDSNPGQGLHGFSGRFTLAKLGSVARIGPGESIEFIVQDDLTSLIELYIIPQGSVVIP